MQGCILSSLNDADGIVREAAYLLQVSVVSNMNAHSGIGSSLPLIAVFASAARDGLVEFLADIRKQNSVVDIWLSSDFDIIDHLDLRLLISRFQISGVVPYTLSAIRSKIEKGISDQALRDRFLKSRKELGSRNKRLSDMQENLERTVSERTSYLVDAERELYIRNLESKNLVKFIKGLSQTETIEEILQVLAQEVKSFHDVRLPVLALVSPEFGARLHFHLSQGKVSPRALQSGWGSKAVSRPWSNRTMIRISDPEDQTYLAQELGRPVVRTVVIPLAKDHRVSSGPLLIFEHMLDEEKVEVFRNFLLPRMEALSTAIDRVLINRELFSASKLWEATFDSLADPIAVIDIDYNVLRMNHAFLRPAVSADIERKKCYELFAGRETPCVGCRLSEWRTARDGKKLESLDWQVRRDQSIYHVNGYPISFQDESQPTTFIHHYADVTKSIELKGSAFQGEKMAAIGLMAGNIAHELNNPLAGLRSLAQVLAADKRYSESVREDLVSIGQAAERSSAIIRDLLDFSSAEDRPHQLVSLNGMIASALNMLKTALYEHVIETCYASDSEVLVWVEPHLLQHVVFNIVNNACQAMEEQGQISIETRSEGDRVVLEIADSGPGIPADVLARIFEPFFTTKRAGQGTGLGLSMSRLVIESFGGTITAENREERGAVFIISLPKKLNRNVDENFNY